MNKLIIEQIDKNKFRIELQVLLTSKWYDFVFFNCFNKTNCFNVRLNHKDNNDGIVKFENTIDLPDSALYNTFITCKIDGEDFYLNKDLEFTKQLNKETMKKISVNFNVPDWCKGKMIYHIFVDRFNRSDTSKLIEKPRKSIHYDLSEEPLLGPDSNGIWTNDFYGGDLKGIIEKLDYIKDLGVSIIYLSPIVESQSNHRYDTGNYLNVDPYVGTNDDLKELCAKAHELAIKIILDGVFNHTGNDSIYFNQYNSYDSDGAFYNRDSYYYNFYKKSYYDNRGHDFKYWWDFENLPECDGNSREWQHFITGENGVIDQWFNCGIDGLRLDVADELTDYFIELIRKACERNKKDSFIYGEVWEQPIYKNRNYIMSAHGMHSIMNYKLMDALIRYYNFNDKNRLKEILKEILEEYPKETRDSLMNSTSTHDISRIITILSSPYLYRPNNQWAWDFDNNNHEFIRNYKLTEDEYNEGKDKYLSYLMSLAFLPGNLTIFYGDEAGLEGLGNLQNRRYFPWNNIDNDILSEVKDIGKIKKDNEFLSTAEIKILDINDKYFMYERYNDNDKILVCTNKSKEGVPLYIPSEYKEKVYTLKKSNTNYLNPYGGIIVKGENHG